MLRLFLLLLTATVAAEENAPARRDPTEPTSLEAEYAKLLAADDAAQADIDSWSREQAGTKSSDAAAEAALKQRIAERLEPVRKAYEAFLARHPNHAQAHLTYGNFLSDRQDESGARAQWEKALQLDPGNADAYNNLAGAYSESERVNLAFEYFAKAITLRPTEASYYHNFANTLYVLRRRAMDYYKINEQQVLARALGLYSNAVRLDPKNFAFAWDFAQTFYVLDPLPTDAALQAWTNALPIAPQEIDRQGVLVHFARLKMLAGRLAEARAQLGVVTDEKYSQIKARLLAGIAEREAAVAKKPGSP